MFVCQWHLDIPFGKQAEAIRIMTAWGKEKFGQRWEVHRVVS